eukprot:6199041-Pleurochrysis_carterae.AAC.1
MQNDCTRYTKAIAAGLLRGRPTRLWLSANLSTYRLVPRWRARPYTLLRDEFQKLKLRPMGIETSTSACYVLLQAFLRTYSTFGIFSKGILSCNAFTDYDRDTSYKFAVHKRAFTAGAPCLGIDKRADGRAARLSKPDISILEEQTNMCDANTKQATNKSWRRRQAGPVWLGNDAQLVCYRSEPTARRLLLLSTHTQSVYLLIRAAKISLLSIFYADACGISEGHHAGAQA